MSDNEIIIGKYSISKYVFMSFPPIFSYVNIETKVTKQCYSFEIIKILEDDKLDPTPFLEYLKSVDC